MARHQAPTAPAGRPFVRRQAVAGWLAAASLTLVGHAAPAQAQSSGLPFNVGAQVLATTAPIDAYVQTQATAFATGDRDKIVAARTALLLPLAGNASVKSQAFLSAYARALNVSLLPIAEGDDPHAKLNVALVVVRAAEQSRSAALTPLVVKLANDPVAAVAVSGLRAAGNLLIYSLADPVQQKNNPLVDAIVKALENNPESDVVTMEAFQAMTREVSGDAAKAVAPQLAAATPFLVDALHDLMNKREEQFANGNIVEPAAELGAITFLTRTQTWPLCTPEQQAETVGLIIEVMQTAANELVTLPAGSNRARAEALRTLVRTGANSLSVAGKQAPVARELVAAANKAANLGTAAAPNEYLANAEAVAAEALKAFPAAATPTTAPTSGPASQPAATAR